MARISRIEGEPVHVHPPLEQEEVVEGDRSAVEPEGDDARDPELGEPL